ncbi:NAD(P)/FAD-dependent oxidoreductase [Virgibacillus soli]|uniref:FAD-binding oxidoreductase n=1 Tax=Paracerasibacillus soli TaxID=480284 RepID=A0ABU5CMK8_9BACI|nr:FAD-binding oxidoreductase [Virgibacillus soli]MDY0407580.1 FAD-binding oxidoreductase [Virgibacillus soli]
MNKCIIIGAGIIGATTAYRLAKSGANVVLIDENIPGRATQAASGIICPWLSQRRNQDWYELAKNGAHFYPQLIQELEDDGEMATGYAKVGAITIRQNEAKLNEIKERAITRRKDAPEIGDIQLLTQAETKDIFPPIADGYGAVYISGGARVSGQLLQDALIRASQKYGAQFIEGKASLHLIGNKITGVKVKDELIEGDIVIAANGAWMDKLFEPLPITFHSYPQKGQLLHIALPNIDTAHWPVVMPPSNQSIVPFDDHIIIGATHEAREVGFDRRVTAGGLHEILTTALEFAPGLAHSTFLKTKVGFRPYTPEFLPVIGKLPHYEGLILANGLGASGLTTGPFIGTQLAQLALDENITIDLSKYDVSNAITF